MNFKIIYTIIQKYFSEGTLNNSNELKVQVEEIDNEGAKVNGPVLIVTLVDVEAVSSINDAMLQVWGFKSSSMEFRFKVHFKLLWGFEWDMNNMNRLIFIGIHIYIIFIEVFLKKRLTGKLHICMPLDFNCMHLML